MSRRKRKYAPSTPKEPRTDIITNKLGSRREVITDTKGRVVGVLVDKTGDGEEWDYQLVSGETTRADMFPHKVGVAEVDSNFWLEDPTISVGDAVTKNIYQGRNVCDVCDKNVAKEELVVAVLHWPSKEPGPYNDFTEYGFRLECKDCVDNTVDYTGYPKSASKVDTSGTTYSSWGTTTYQQKCPEGHFDLFKFGRGGLVLTSWRGTKGGRIAFEADYCVFESADWDTYWQPPVVTYPGTDGKTFPPLSGRVDEKLPPCAMLKWYDYSPPPSVALDYAKLVAKLVRKGSTVQIGCFGGHGRTGTFAALILLELGVVREGQKAIDYVRKEYCEEAIETKGQEDAIRAYAVALGLPAGTPPPVTVTATSPATPLRNNGVNVAYAPKAEPMPGDALPTLLPMGTPYGYTQDGKPLFLDGSETDGPNGYY